MERKERGTGPHEQRAGMHTLTHTQLNLHKWWAGAHAHAAQLAQVELHTCVHMRQPSTQASQAAHAHMHQPATRAAQLRISHSGLQLRGWGPLI